MSKEREHEQLKNVGRAGICERGLKYRAVVACPLVTGTGRPRPRSFCVSSAFILLNLLPLLYQPLQGGPLSSVSGNAEPSLLKSQLRFTGFH